VRKAIDRASLDQNDYDHAYRLMMPMARGNMSVRWPGLREMHQVASEFVGAVTDVTATKRAEEKPAPSLRRNSPTLRA